MRILIFSAIFGLGFSTSTAVAGSDRLAKIMGLGGVCSDCDLSKKNLSGARMNGASFPRSNFTATDLSGAELRGSNFSRAIFRRADLSNSNVDGSNFSWADFSGSTLDEMHGRGINFSRATLTGAKGREAEFVATNFSYAKMLGASFEEASFEFSNLSNADMSGAKLQEARFDVSNLSFVIFGTADLRKAEFSRVDFRNTQFGNSNLKGAVFSQVFLAGADLSKTRGLKSQQLALACGNPQTRLPNSLTIKDCSNVAWAKDFDGAKDEDAIFSNSFLTKLDSQDIANVREETRKAMIEGRKALLEAGRALAEAFNEADHESFFAQWDDETLSDEVLLYQRQQRSLARTLRYLSRLELKSTPAQAKINQAMLNIEQAQEILSQHSDELELAGKQAD